MEKDIRSVEAFSDIDKEVGLERFDREQKSERLTRKLERIMADDDLNMLLGAHLQNVILPSLTAVQFGLYLNIEQAGRVDKVIGETLKSQFSPEELGRFHQGAELRYSRTW